MLQMEFSHDKASEVEKDLLTLYLQLINDIFKEVVFFKGNYTQEEYQQPIKYDGLIGFSVGVRTNLDGLNYKIEEHINRVYSTGLEKFVNHLTEIYKSIFDNEDTLKDALENKWCGANYEDSITESTRQYTYKLKKEILASLIRGDSNKQLKDMITKLVTSFRKQITSILITETTYVTNQALLDKGIQEGYTKVMINEILDSRTCGFCSGKDGDIVPIKDVKVGATIPPFHKNCRGTIEYIK